MIITEVTRVQDSEFCTPFEPSLGDDKHIAAWKEVTDAIHQQGACVFPQLHQPGRQYTKTILGHEVSAPSPLACPIFDEVPHELTTEEVWDNIHRFGDAALRAKKAGFDGVEIGKYVIPSLTTLKQPVDSMARETARILFDIIGKKAKHQHCVFDGELVIRDSTISRT